MRKPIEALLAACHVLTFDAPMGRPANPEEVAIERMMAGFDTLATVFCATGLSELVDTHLLAPFQAMLTASADICGDIHSAEKHVRELMTGAS